VSEAAACDLQVFGSSPDETAYCRLYLNRETTADALTMMQPQLLAYTLEVRICGMSMLPAAIYPCASVGHSV
jgi:hypothetical protein